MECSFFLQVSQVSQIDCSIVIKIGGKLIGQAP